jgi:hypothetical protein
MSTASWTSVVTLTDVPSAELPAERLRSEGVTVEIRSDSAILGQARYCDLIVPSNLLHRANCLQSQWQCPEVELDYWTPDDLP